MAHNILLASETFIFILSIYGVYKIFSDYEDKKSDELEEALNLDMTSYVMSREPYAGIALNSEIENDIQNQAKKLRKERIEKATRKRRMASRLYLLVIIYSIAIIPIWAKLTDFSNN